jgi:nucleotide-binding universal stress UspA family protein
LRILAAIDDSPCSREVIRELLQRSWPEGSEVRILSVVHPRTWFHDPFGVGAAIYVQSRQAEERRVAHDLEQATEQIHDVAPHLSLSTATMEGSPGEKVVEEAERWHADLVLVGTHGYGAAQRLLHGSVSRAVAAHAPCSVEVVRPAAH